MTRQGFLIKWSWYSAGLLPVLFFEFTLLCNLPVFGVIPVLLPLCVAAVGVFEGAMGGAGFGLAVGVLADAVYPGTPGGMILGLTLAGLGAGLLTRYGVRQGFPGFLLCAAATLSGMDLLRAIPLLLQRSASFTAVLSVAVREILWSLCFAPLIYLLFRAIWRHITKRLY